MDVVRWVLQDMDTLEEYTVELNPNEAGNYHFNRQFDFSQRGDGRVRTVKSKPAPMQWTFSGVVRTQSHHDSLVEWQKKPGKVRVTDHLGRTFEVMMEALSMLDRRPVGDDTWRFRYTFTCLLLRRIA